MIISLFTSRVILKSLGVEDFGIYTAVAGVVTLLSMITGPISGAISRYLTFALGNNNTDTQRKTFSCSVTIIFLFGIIALVLLETIGLWFLNSKMNIPSERMYAANWVFHVAVVSFLLNIFTIPYNAAIIAHEKMSAFAYIGILDGLLKIGVAFILFIVGFDKLIAYSFFILLIGVINLLIYLFYCNKHFLECRHFRLIMDKQLFSGMFSFAGWNLLGGAANVIHVQGTNILLNIFGGPIVNTAQGLANQVNNAVTGFVNNFTTAFTPSIIKSYAANEKKYMLSLLYQGARFSTYLVLFFAIPLIIEADSIVNLWLGQCPEHTVPLIQLILIGTVIDSISKTLIAALNATGIIRDYQLIVGGILIMNLPISYLALKLGAPVEVTAVVYCFLSIAALLARLILSKKLVGVSIVTFCRDVILNVVFVTIASIIPSLFLFIIIPPSIWRLIIIVLVGFISTALSIYFLGCNDTERGLISAKFLSSIYKIRRRPNDNN